MCIRDSSNTGLTGIHQYRINNGAWIDLGTIHNLQDFGRGLFLGLTSVNLSSGDELEFQTLYDNTTATTVSINQRYGRVGITRLVSSTAGTIVINNVFTDENAFDLIKGIFDKFAIKAEISPNDPYLLFMEPYSIYANTGVIKDWHNKRNHDFSETDTSIIQDLPSTIRLTDAENDDRLNQFALDRTGNVFGTVQFVSDSDLSDGEEEYGDYFAPTPMKQVEGTTNFIIPQLHALEDGEKKTVALKPHLLYDNGFVPISVSYEFDGDNYSGYYLQSHYTEFPVNRPTTIDIHYGNQYDYFYPNQSPYTKFDVYSEYWAPYLNSLYAVSYTHLRAHETVLDLVCRLLL